MDGTLRANWIPGTNGPFWSLTYEVVYYFGFGIAAFLKGRQRVALMLVLALVAGPRILLLAPIWLMGVGVHHAIKWRRPPVALALVLFAASLSLLIWLGLPGTNFWWNDFTILERRLQLDYAVGALVALNFYAAAGLDVPLGLVLAPGTRLIRWLGAMTFSLYLCHRPMLQFVSAFHVAPVGSAAQTAWLYGWVLAVTIAVTALSEQVRPAFRNAFARWLHPRDGKPVTTAPL